MVASASAIKAGSAYVELGLRMDKLQGGLNQAGNTIKGIGAGIARTGAIITGLGTTVMAGFIKPVMDAGDAMETENRFGAVFKDQAATAGAAVDDMASRIGRAGTDLQDTMSTFQAFQVGLGFEGSDAANMSATLTELSLDFASFANIADDDAATRFLAGISGEAEPLKRFGINVNAAATAQKALEMGLADSTSALTEQDKVLARIAIIQQAMTEQGALGDATTTAGSFNNQMKALQATLKETSQSIGAALIPPLQALLQIVNPIIQDVSEWVQENPELVTTIAAVAAGVTAAGVAITGMGLAAIAAGSAITAIGTIVGALTTALPLLVAAGAALVIAWETDWLGMGAVVKETLGGIVDAIKAGDVEAAMDIMWTGIELAWRKGLQTLKDLLNQGLQELSQNAKALIGVVGLIPGAAGIKDSLQAVVAGLAGATSTADPEIAKLQAKLSKQNEDAAVAAAKKAAEDVAQLDTTDYTGDLMAGSAKPAAVKPALEEMPKVAAPALAAAAAPVMRGGLRANTVSAARLMMKSGSADRQIQLQEESNEIQDEIRTNVREFNEKMRPRVVVNY